MKKYLLFLFLFIAFTIPLLAVGVGFAYPVVGISNISGLFTKIIKVIWLVAMGVAIICFIISGIMFMTAGGKPESIKLARNSVISGVVGVVVAIATWLPKNVEPMDHQMQLASMNLLFRTINVVHDQ